MGDLYKKAFSNPGMTPRQTNAHWKREQDNYLSQIGAMDLIKKDPMASLGYKIRSANPNMTLEMGGNLDDSKFRGLYQFPNRAEYDNYEGPRFDGTLDVAVGLDPQHYGATIAHELGHVGSRNSQTDESIRSTAKDEEKRQRLVDIANNPPSSKARMEAIWFLNQQYGMSPEDIMREADDMAVRLGLKKAAPAKKKKKLKTAEWSASDWNPEAGID